MHITKKNIEWSAVIVFARSLPPTLMKIALHMSAAAGAFEYMLELEPSHSSGADLPIHRSLATSAGVSTQGQGRVRTASTQGRSLLAEVDFTAIIAKIIEQTAALLGC